jgi:hypothetical protein
MSTSQYHDRIQRATQQLAQLQARELLASQRREIKARENAKRQDKRRRERVAELVFLTGAQSLDDAELVGALLMHAERRRDSEIRTEAHALGTLRMTELESNPRNRPRQTSSLQFSDLCRID